MQIEIHRDPSGGFAIIEEDGCFLDHREYFHLARSRAMTIANQRDGCIIVSRVNDDVPATELSRTRKGI